VREAGGGATDMGKARQIAVTHPGYRLTCQMFRRDGQFPSPRPGLVWAKFPFPLTNAEAPLFRTAGWLAISVTPRHQWEMDSGCATRPPTRLMRSCRHSRHAPWQGL